MSRLPSISRGPMALMLAGGAALGLYLLLLLGSFVDPAFAGSEMGRNLSFDGTPIGGTEVGDLDQAVIVASRSYQDTPVEIDAGYGAASSDAGTLGLQVDVAASVEAIEAANQPPFLLRPFAWVASFFGTNDVAAEYEVDRAVLHDALVGLELPGVTGWRAPTFVADATGVSVEPGRSGSGVDADRFAALLVEAARAGGSPLEVTPELVDVPAPISDHDAELIAAAAAAATASPLEVTAGWVTESIDVATLRSWLVLVIDNGDATWDIDHDEVTADLESRFAATGSAGSDVSFTVENGQVQIIDGLPRTACCDEGSSELILDALQRGTGRVEVPLILEETARGAEWAASLGIVEEVASFTTHHACCQNRVVNIHLMADATRGVIIEPGETFSLNDHVGRRTAEKGYLPAGGITNGVLVDQLGGGVSQYATTLFNAAFFAGLDFGEYQAHTIYFSRYPYGREATLSHPAPDLQIRNTSPYGVLIWPTYTDTSITVTLYSTKHVTAEQTGQSESMSGVCTVVRTERTRTYDDGREVIDHVSARYRPEEGVNCAGESTFPTTVPEAPPEPETPDPPPETPDPPPETPDPPPETPDPPPEPEGSG